MDRTTSDLLREWRDDLSAVPSITNDYVCDWCLGPVKPGWNHCAGCHRVLGAVAVPTVLRRSVVPMTAALSPSKWYTALVNYKKFQPELRGIVVSIAHHFILSRRAHISELLGGEPSMITIVPSKRGVAYDAQPLRTAIAAVDALKGLLRQTLSYDPSEPVPHLGFNAAAFPAGPTPVNSQRILLIEDTWVTGATSVSAAAALLQHGAESVAILPVARVVSADYWPEDHPYRAAMSERFMPDSDSWPR